MNRNDLPKGKYYVFEVMMDESETIFHRDLLEEFEVSETRPYPGSPTEEAAGDDPVLLRRIIHDMRPQRNQLRSRIFAGLPLFQQKFGNHKCPKWAAEWFLSLYNFANRDRRIIFPLPAELDFNDTFQR